jgi:hypothetical protein
MDVDRRRRRVRRGGVGGALAGLAVVLTVLVSGSPAWAHTQLLSADPATDATLATAPTTVTLVFSERLNPDFTTIVVSDAAKQRIPASAPAIERSTGTLTLGRQLGNGTYTVAYRVVSNDGHTVQGSYAFTVADPALPSAATVVQPAAAEPETSRRPGGIPTVVLIGLAVLGVVLAAVAAWLYLSGRRRTARNAPGA